MAWLLDAEGWPRSARPFPWPDAAHQGPVLIRLDQLHEHPSLQWGFGQSRF